MADQVYLGTVFVNNDPDTLGLVPGDLVQLDTTLDNAVLKVTGSNSPDVIGVIVVGGSQHAQVVVCAFPGQRIRINIAGSSSVTRGDLLVSDGTIPGLCKVDNAATADEIFAVAIANKTAGVGDQVDALFTSSSAGVTTIGGANANAYYITTRSTNAPVNAFNLATLTSGLLSVSISGGIATLSTTPPVVASNSGTSFSANDSTDDATNTEIVIWQFTFNTALQTGATLTFNFSFQAKSPGGAATFKLYAGGSFVDRWSPPVDGSLIGSPVIRNVSPYTATTLTGTLSNPGGVIPVKITMISPIGQTAYARECSGSITS